MLKCGTGSSRCHSLKVEKLDLLREREGTERGRGEEVSPVRRVFGLTTVLIWKGGGGVVVVVFSLRCLESRERVCECKQRGNSTRR